MIIYPQSRTMLLISLAASVPQMLWSQEAEEDDYDLASRGPYEYKFRVDDPETYNKYEVREQEWMNKVYQESDKCS